MKPVLVTFLLLTQCLLSLAQSVAEIKKLNAIDTNQIELIEKKKLHNLIRSTKSPYTLVAIYTNMCGGTKYLLNYVNKAHEKYSDSLQILLCSSMPYGSKNEMIKVLQKYSVNLSPVYIINSELYKDDPDDDRMKGYRFRHSICKPCRKDIIGVPYYILFNQKGKVVYGGYPTRINFDSLVNAYLTRRQ